MTTFRINNIDYTKTNAGYCYKNENGKQVRIGKAEFEQAFEQYIQDAEDQAITDERQAKKDEPKAKKPATKRRSKDIAFEGNGVTLTAKQVEFIKRIPDTCFYENGLESTPWCDVLADEIGGEFANKPMTVGAMISTIREKGLIYVDVMRVNGKKAKYFGFTELGKKIAAELGLN